jgi:hypothetical protein
LAKVNEVVNKKKNNSGSFLFFVFLVLLTLFAFVPVLQAAEHAAQVTLAWDPNPEPSVAGYRVYFGKESGFYTNVLDVGNRTDCVIPGLEAGTTYFFACTAYSATGDESNFSGEIVYTTEGGSSSSSNNRISTKCFIATAAYGSWLAPEVVELREFRDRYLLTNQAGQAFVDWYYRASPPVAAFIAEHESLKTAVRWGLAPVVYAVKYPSAAGLFLLVVVIVGIRAGRDKKVR